MSVRRSPQMRELVQALWEGEVGAQAGPQREQTHHAAPRRNPASLGHQPGDAVLGGVEQVGQGGADGLGGALLKQGSSGGRRQHVKQAVPIVLGLAPPCVLAAVAAEIVGGQLGDGPQLGEGMAG